MRLQTAALYTMNDVFFGSYVCITVVSYYWSFLHLLILFRRLFYYDLQPKLKITGYFKIFFLCRPYGGSSYLYSVLGFVLLSTNFITRHLSAVNSIFNVWLQLNNLLVFFKDYFMIDIYQGFLRRQHACLSTSCQF